MKKHFLTLLMLLSLFQFGYAQVPSAIPYQAVVRNGNGNILPNHNVQLRFTIHDSITNGNVLYQETHSISTNGQGLVITNIGQGTSTTGTFSGINWGKNNKFVQTELSINNDNTFTDLGTTQFLSVPYALHAGNGLPSVSSAGEMLYSDGTNWVKVAPGSQGQTLTFCDGKPHWGACPPPPPSSTINNGLVAYYPFNGNANDESGNGNNGIVNGATLTTNRFGNSNKAYSFDGINDYFATPSINGVFSISFWVKINQINDNNYLLDARTGLLNGWVYYALGDRDFGTGWDSVFVNGTYFNSTELTSFPTNTWAHVYLKSVTPFNDDIFFMTSYSNTGGCMDGKLDDIRIYNRALTQEEITYLAIQDSSGNTNNYTNIGLGVTDIDGNTYDTIRICNQTWTKKNLNVSRYRNGDIIPQVTDPTEWANLTTGAWCYYNNDSANGALYGKLYNWYAVNDPRGLAPEGWHVSTDGEWNKLVKCLDVNADTICRDCSPSNIAGGMMKSTSLWNYPNLGASNSSGFSGIPSGFRTLLGDFMWIGNYGYWWTTKDSNDIRAWYTHLVYDNSSIIKYLPIEKKFGFSVRCVKDEPPSTLNDGLVAYYPFNGNANDESGNGNNGVVNGAILTTDRFGNSGKAYSFDNLDNVINVPEISPSLGSPNSSASYSMWFKGQSGIAYPGASGVILHSNTNPNNFDYQIRFEVGFSSYLGSGFRKKVYYRCPAENNEPYSLDEYDTNIWHNILVVVNGASGEYKYYFDGVLDSNMYFNFNPQNNYYLNNRTWQIGSYSPQPNHASHQFYGKIDDIRIYNRAITQEEISYLAGH